MLKHSPIRTLTSLVVLFTYHAASAVHYTAMVLPRTGFIQTAGFGLSTDAEVGSGYNGTSAHALIWPENSAGYIDLHPAGYVSSEAYEISGDNQVGAGYLVGPSSTSVSHALLWHSTAASAIDLHPAGFNWSTTTGLSATIQVGYGVDSVTGNTHHALRWSGSANTAVDLTPSGFLSSEAYDVRDNAIVGVGLPATALGGHALLWQGSADNIVDLNPSNLQYSQALGVSESSQVGEGGGPATNHYSHALLWHGSAERVVDLQPAGFTGTSARAVAGDFQVGSGYGPATGYHRHALVWNGTADSVVDLHPALEALHQNFIYSEALGIDEMGNIIGNVFSSGYSLAVLWTPDTGVFADYNNDGTVDAADYIYWRRGIGPLHNEIATIGYNTPDDYTEWRAHFGNTNVSANGFGTAETPEPTTLSLFSLGMAVGPLRRWRRRRLA